MIIHEIEQGTEEWDVIRCGKITASRFSDVMAKGAGKTRKSYMMKILAERLSGMKQDSYSNDSMQWGIEKEQEAREYYESVNGVVVRQVGFVEENDYLGCSPDGLVGEDGLLEIKCPNTATHIQYILDGKFPSIYKAQVQGQMLICNRSWCDFVSFDPRVEDRPYLPIRVNRDTKYHGELSEQIEKFISDLDRLELQIKSPF